MDVTESGNIMQRVFDRMPAYPVPISIFALYDLLPFDRESIRYAIKRLRAAGVVEAIPTSKFAYRRCEGAERPAEGRGGVRRGI